MLCAARARAQHNTRELRKRRHGGVVNSKTGEESVRPGSRHCCREFNFVWAHKWGNTVL